MASTRVLVISLASVAVAAAVVTILLNKRDTDENKRDDVVIIDDFEKEAEGPAAFPVEPIFSDREDGPPPQPSF